jgi:lysophospholipase L1-like esterase
MAEMRNLLFAAAVCVLGVLPARAEAPRTRVVCFGDSITKAGYPAVLGKALGDGVEVTNAGVNGNTTAQALRRMERDVLAHKPDVVVIFFGTNDARLAEPKVHVPVERYRENLQKMIDAVTKAGGRVVLCTPPPIEQGAYFTRHARAPFDAAGGLEKVLGEYCEAARGVAERNKAPLVDLNRRLAKEEGWRSADGVHPTEKGTALIARFVGEAVRPLMGGTNE